MTDTTEWLEPDAVRKMLGVTRQRLQQLRKAKTLSRVRYDKDKGVWMYALDELQRYQEWRQTYDPLTNYLPPKSEPRPKRKAKAAPVVTPQELADMDEWRAQAQAYLDSIVTGLERINGTHDEEADGSGEGHRPGEGSKAEGRGGGT